MTLLIGVALSAIIAVYLAAIAARLFMIFADSTPSRAGTARLHASWAIPQQGSGTRQDSELPKYTILVPLDRPATPSTDPGPSAVSELIASVSALDYPASRLQVLLLAGDGDWPLPDEVPLPGHFDVIDTGRQSAAGKRAAGLALATGELCAVYEPGQHPDRGQLRAAATAFRQLPPWVVCLRPEVRQALPYPGWLAQCAAAEGAVTGVLVPRGLGRLGLPVPGGGPSSHFRTDALRHLGAWSDADAHAASIGARIARRGWSTRMVDSVTFERAQTRPRPWIRQRAAAIRLGYLGFVSALRRPLRHLRGLRPGYLTTVAVTTAATSVTALASPLFLLLTVAWVAAGTSAFTGVVPLPVLSAAAAALVLGNVLTAYSLMAGCMEAGFFRAVRTMLLAPAYWALASVAAYRALLPVREAPETAHAVAAPVAAA
jgi:cellulose synthase/poly-beta-1,6-N-acetylglucosamine synthase-like glycosyltransferase